MSGPTSQPSAAQLTGIELLENQLAYRDALNAAMKEKMLDDTHDLHGLTLYTLKFDLTVMPGDNASRSLVVLLQLSPDEWEDGIDHADEFTFLPTGATIQFPGYRRTGNVKQLFGFRRYFNWVNSLNQGIAQDTQAAEARLLQNRLTEADLGSIEASLESDIRGDRTQSPINAIERRILGAISSKPVDVDSDIRAALAADEDGKTVKESLVQFLISSPSARTKLLQDASEIKARARLKYAVARWIWHGYADHQELSDLVEIPAPNQGFAKSPPTITNEAYFSNCARPVDGGIDAFNGSVNSLNLASTPRGFAIEPKEYAQDISAVSARQDLIDLSLALSAAFGHVSIGDSASYMRNSQSFLQAIRRQPLAIGFGNGRLEFGWLLGPRFGIKKGGKAAFEQTPERQSFTAEIGVPAWWSAVALTGRCFWLGENGDLEPADTSPNDVDLAQRRGNLILESIAAESKKLIGNPKAISGDIWPTYDPLHQSGAVPRDPALRGNPRPSTIAIPLPTDPAAITTALLFHNDRTQLRPLLADASYSLSESGSSDPEQTIMIRGRDLWRNPMVSVGNMKASTVDVMPDMGGLIAHFTQVQVPPHSGKENLPVNMTVTTTFGSDTLQGAVTVVPKAVTPKQQPFLTIGAHFAQVGQALQFAIDATKLSSTAAANAELLLRPAGSLDTALQVIVARPSSASQQSVAFNLPSAANFATALPGTNLPSVFSVDVKAEDLTGGTSILNSGPQTVVICNNIQTDLAATVNPNPATIPQPTVGTPMPVAIELLNTTALCPASEKLLLQAFPDLQRAIDNSLLKVQLDGTTILSATLRKDPTTTKLTNLTLPTGSSIPSKTGHSLQVIWTDTQNQQQIIPAGTLTFN